MKRLFANVHACWERSVAQAQVRRPSADRQRERRADCSADSLEGAALSELAAGLITVVASKTGEYVVFPLSHRLALPFGGRAGFGSRRTQVLYGGVMTPLGTGLRCFCCGALPILGLQKGPRVGINTSEVISQRMFGVDGNNAVLLKIRKTRT